MVCVSIQSPGLDPCLLSERAETSWEVTLSPKDYCSTGTLKRRERLREWGGGGVFRTVELINKPSKEIKSLSKYSCFGQEEEQLAISVQQHSISSEKYAAV